MSQLPISNVINVSVSQTQTGLGLYNTSNLALFTTDVYNPNTFGSAGYSLYLAPSQLGSDFGTTSVTYEMGTSVFSQQPNILANSGYLAVIPLLPAVQDIGFDSVPASGSFHLVYGSQSVIVNWNETAANIQAAIRGSFTGFEQATVAGSIGSGSNALVVTMYGYYGTPGTFTTTSNTLETSGIASVTIAVAAVQSGETLSAAITRTQGLIQYFGAMANVTADTQGSTDVLAAGATIQSLNKILFEVFDTPADLGSPSGLIYAVQQASLTQTRCLYYNDGTPADSLNMMAAYAGRGLSTNFAGTNTTSTMHLKQLVGITPDLSITQTLLNQAAVCGADLYVSLQGVPAVFTSGANQYFDQVYDLQAFVGALQVAGFNYLAQAQTKIPQTEQGMSGLKAAYRAVCQQYVSNAFIAPGAWTSSTTFGNQTDFTTNISTIGYYIYSQPVSQQAAAARASRTAPLIQIAAKEAGAIQSSDLLIFVNP